jgi:transposase-like protein
MKTALMESGLEIKCPDCNLDVSYKYGRTPSGKQRYLCLNCGRQFTPDAKKHTINGKPLCSECGRIMHLYKIDGEVVRFRCSGYPECKTFKKYILKEEEE